MRKTFLLWLAKLLNVSPNRYAEWYHGATLNTHHYCVGREFAEFLGPARQGGKADASGEAFRTIILGMLDKYPKIRIDFTRCRGGCSAGWFKAAFGELSQYGYRPYEIFDRINVVSRDPSDIHLIADYVHSEMVMGQAIYRETSPRIFESIW
jgi:hypothetical protein